MAPVLIATPRLHHRIAILSLASLAFTAIQNPTMRRVASLFRRGTQLISSPAPARLFHTSNAALKLDGPTSETGAVSLSSRWLSDLTAKAQANISSGRQVEESKCVLSQLNDRWVELLAGSEGFLSGPQWAGLSKEAVRWGDMVSLPETVFK